MPGTIETEDGWVRSMRYVRSVYCHESEQEGCDRHLLIIRLIKHTLADLTKQMKGSLGSPIPSDKIIRKTVPSLELELRA